MPANGFTYAGDTLTGGQGDDKFVFTVGDSKGPIHDDITDFTSHSGAHGDTIELDGWSTYGVTGFATLQAHMFNVGHDTWIVGSGTAANPTAGTDVIVVEDVKVSQLHSADFVFA